MPIHFSFVDHFLPLFFKTAAGIFFFWTGSVSCNEPGRIISVSVWFSLAFTIQKAENYRGKCLFIESESEYWYN